MTPASGNPVPASPRVLHLLYHRLTREKSSYLYDIARADFEAHVTLFHQLRHAPPSDLSPELTFDDGHMSDYELALPILAAHGLQARFFITAGWTSIKPGYMGWQQVRALHQAGQLIGAHGFSHLLLNSCDSKTLQDELNHSRHLLEDKLGTAITTMSLPGGRYNHRVLAACHAAGYTHIYTSQPRAVSLPLGPLVGRVNLRGDMQLPWIASLFQPDTRTLPALARQYKIKAQLQAALGDRLYGKLWSILNRGDATVPENGPA